MNSTAVLTICSINYISKALVLLDSCRVHNPGCDYFLLVVDRKDLSVTEKIARPGLEILWAEDLGIVNFFQKAFKFDLIELNTNVKPTILKQLLQTYHNVIYFDPDICVYGSLEGILAELEGHSMLLTPHYFTPISDGHKPDDTELLKFGVFNLGFIAITHHPQTVPFLDWWSERCLEYGFYEPQTGLAVDQKWMSLAPGFFDGVKVSRDPGLNVAFWNLHERTLEQREGRWYVNQNHPLTFMHFSSFDENKIGVVGRKQSRFPDGSRPDFEQIAFPYRVQLQANRALGLDSRPYGFAQFADGCYITPTLRRLYAGLQEQLGWFVEENPFALDSPTHQFALKHRLTAQEQSSGKTFRDLQRYDRATGLALKLLRMLLWALGPNRYFDLMRFMAHISSIRQQAGAFGRKP